MRFSELTPMQLIMQNYSQWSSYYSLKEAKQLFESALESMLPNSEQQFQLYPQVWQATKNYYGRITDFREI